MATITNKQQKITPCLWFDNNVEDAVKFYTTVFKKSKKGKVSYYDDNGHMPAGTVLTISFQLAGQQFLALNGGPDFKFTEAISFVINCDTQKEIDYYWEKLSKGGEQQQCGWLKDKFGVSWQVTPSFVGEMLAGKTTVKTSRVMQAIFKMRKLDIKALKQAYAGK